MDVMTTKGPFSAESRFSDEELDGWLDDPVLVATPLDDEDSGACHSMQDVISHHHHLPWTWQLSPTDMPHSEAFKWTSDNGESPGSVSPASASPSAFQIRQPKHPTEHTRGPGKALSLPVPRRNRPTTAERRRYAPVFPIAFYSVVSYFIASFTFVCELF